VALYGNVVYDKPGNYTLRVPVVTGIGRLKKLGMTGMAGSSGILKADWKAPSYEHQAPSVRLDDLVPSGQPICMLKADVEGYEPQVLQTAKRILTQEQVPALQLELTKTPKMQHQTCASIATLNHLHALGFRFKQVNNHLVDKLDLTPTVGTWKTAPGPWAKLPSFPSSDAWQHAGRSMSRSLLGRFKGLLLNSSVPPMSYAYRTDFRSFSTNLIALRADNWRCAGVLGRCPRWPALACV